MEKIPSYSSVKIFMLINGLTLIAFVQEETETGYKIIFPTKIAAEETFSNLQVQFFPVVNFLLFEDDENSLLNFELLKRNLVFEPKDANNTIVELFKQYILLIVETIDETNETVEQNHEAQVAMLMKKKFNITEH